MGDHGDGNIKVVVRCRPLNSRELARGAKGLIRMVGNQTFLDPPDETPQQQKGRATERKTMAFSFDKSYWSAGPRDEPGYCSQQTLFDDLGKELLDHSFAGFNACILAYGADKGIIPLTCSELFARIDRQRAGDPHVNFVVEVSYIEIYNEKVRDLLNPKNKGNLKVREHPSLGPYVEDLSKLVAASYDEMMTLMDEGNKARTVAATNMNETSSRSHAVFTLLLTMKRHDVDTNLDTEKVSRISLVDLAGSERANSTGATGQRLKEGANINKSLTTLGKVISSLALASSAEPGKKGKGKLTVFPKVLTWLLKDSLGGNSKTAMIAAISPADYDETLSTLRYADQAKKIKNKAVVNEDPNHLPADGALNPIARVTGGGGAASEATYDPTIPASEQKVQYMAKDGTVKTVTKAELQEQLETSEKLMQSLNETWEEKLVKTQAVQKEREAALEELGITVEKNHIGVHTPKRMPHLVNLVGRVDSEKNLAIRLTGDNIKEEHCWFENNDGVVTLHGHPDSITVRKQRAKSSMHITLTAADLEALTQPSPGTRPGSPTSDTDVDHDWNFALREAALARLHGLDPGLDSLPDEDINKLYDRITKLKTARDHTSKGRPESSLSHADDVWSESGRPAPSDLTDDTSLEANGVEGSLRDMQTHLGDYEARLGALAEVSEVEEDLRAEKEQMEHALQVVQNQMKRLLDIRAKGLAATEDDLKPFEPQIYTARQLRLIRKVLDKWRSHRSFSMAETVLSNAVLVKEANIISKELEKEVSYNFTIASGGTLACPASALEGIAGLGEFGDVADPILASRTQPSVGVKVLDKNNNAIYVWSLERLQQQLQRMRNLTAYSDRPSYSRHFSSSEPFYDPPPSGYSFIGNAMVSLAPLSRRFSSTSTAPIFCRYTAEAIGSCRIDIKVATVTHPSKSLGGSTSTSRSSSPIPSTLPSGSKLRFTVSIDQVKGLSSVDFSSIHAQIRLSSFIGPAATQDEVYPSKALDMDTTTLSDLKFRQTFSVAITAKTLAFLRSSYAPIEFFAQVRPTYLERLERWDELRELRMVNRPSGSNGELRPMPTNLPPMRRSESDFVVEQSHDVVVWAQIRELTAEGDYLPVPVQSQGHLDPGVFCIHQGLQRRLTLTMVTNSGRQLPWLQINRARAGNIRLLDPRGQVQDSTSKDFYELKLLKDQPAELNTDGTSTLTVNALWDSSVHDSLLLNRVTAANHRILIQVQWFVEVESCLEPVQFSMDLAVMIQGRDAGKPSRLYNFLNSSKTLSKTSSVFNLRMTPPLTRSSKDLWRLDTSGKYVRNEDILGSWRPRGISVVEDYVKLDTTERRSADVQAVKVILAAVPPQQFEAEEKWRDSDELLRKSVELWKKKFGHHGEIALKQDPSELDSPSTTTFTEDDEPTVTIKLQAQTKLMARTGQMGAPLVRASPVSYAQIILLGPLLIQPGRYRPYLSLYARSNEVEELAVISLPPGLKVENDPNWENMTGVSGSLCSSRAIINQSALKHKNTFTLYTSSNSYAMKAPNAKEQQSWMLKLDPTRIP
ncbi:kinesin-like protein [Rhizoctonia solani AG-1 IA]|uniref:Kinesin-like protein n=1 Tax=Thanatephorus cucumeris (strain AG1-IA) TaxID=983506 RepID=L8WJK4_THACA|nr:kinesin-like protein [Rhizoctonia solani AG-1 IA]